ncbi:hypothetical protein JW905_16535 [bacterium]|nr:hypothetical protein [candidate division CSSED10-310 bacterium]
MRTKLLFVLLFGIVSILPPFTLLAQPPGPAEAGAPAAAAAPDSDLSGEVMDAATAAIGEGAIDAPPEPAPEPPRVPGAPRGELVVKDVKDDNGSALAIKWRPATTADAWVVTAVQLATGKEIYRNSQMLPGGESEYDLEFTRLTHGKETTVSVAAQEAGITGEPGVTATGTPRANLFNTNRINVLIALSAFFILVLFFVSRAKAGASLFIRRIAGLDAVEEAVGRATEMGRPILYVPGLSSMSDVATIAALNILGPIAEKAATYETKIIVPNRDPIVFTVAREVVKNSFSQAGRPDLFSDDLVFFLTDSQFGYAAAVDGIIVREQPATNFFLGMFWAESLVMAETGAATGAIQIAGTDSATQLPFFIVSCDYTLIGEELYAASAYLGREPVLRGTLKAQDYMKMLLLITALTGIVLAAFGSFSFFHFLGLQ